MRGESTDEILPKWQLAENWHKNLASNVINTCVQIQSIKTYNITEKLKVDSCLSRVVLQCLTQRQCYDEHRILMIELRMSGVTKPPQCLKDFYPYFPFLNTLSCKNCSGRAFCKQLPMDFMNRRSHCGTVYIWLWVWVSQVWNIVRNVRTMRAITLMMMTTRHVSEHSPDPSSQCYPLLDISNIQVIQYQISARWWNQNNKIPQFLKANTCFSEEHLPSKQSVFLFLFWLI